MMKLSGPPAPVTGGEVEATPHGGQLYHQPYDNELWIQLVPNLATNGNTTNYTLKVHITHCWYLLRGHGLYQLVAPTAACSRRRSCDNDVSVLPDPVWPTNNAISSFMLAASGLDTDGDAYRIGGSGRTRWIHTQPIQEAQGTMDVTKIRAGDGWSNLEKYQNDWNPTRFYHPPHPPNFQLTLLTNGNVQLFWDRALGAVTGYVVEKDTGPASRPSRHWESPRTIFSILRHL